MRMLQDPWFAGPARYSANELVSSLIELHSEVYLEDHLQFQLRV